MCSRLLFTAQQLLERVALWEAIAQTRTLTTHFAQHCAAAAAASASASDSKSLPFATPNVPEPLCAAFQVGLALLFRVLFCSALSFCVLCCVVFCRSHLIQSVASALYRASRSVDAQPYASAPDSEGKTTHLPPPRYVCTLFVLLYCAVLCCVCALL